MCFISQNFSRKNIGSSFFKYSNYTVIKENNFYSDFLNIIDQIDTKFIFFGIDDVAYLDSADMKKEGVEKMLKFGKIH
jgi:hypothetical protein